MSHFTSHPSIHSSSCRIFKWRGQQQKQKVNIKYTETKETENRKETETEKNIKVNRNREWREINTTKRNKCKRPKKHKKLKDKK